MTADRPATLNENNQWRDTQTVSSGNLKPLQADGSSRYESTLKDVRLCLLRTIECYGTLDARQYTASDLFTHLYDGSPDYELSREQAIAQAPLVAAMLVHQQRTQELAHMEPLYTSPQMQREYPVYQVWQQQAGGVNYPVIWASHNAGLYRRVDGQWCVAGFAKSREEAEAKIAKAAQSDAD